MEKYKEKLTAKLRSVSTLLTLGGLFMIYFSISDTSKRHIPETIFGDFFSGFQLGLGIAVILIGAYTVGSLTAALKDEKKLKALYIKETDERNLKISELVGMKLYKSIALPLLFATVISGYFSMAVFFTLLATVAFIAAMTWGRYLYYNKNI